MYVCVCMYYFNGYLYGIVENFGCNDFQSDCYLNASNAFFKIYNQRLKITLVCSKAVVSINEIKSVCVYVCR